jgi:hypothetical protein
MIIISILILALIVGLCFLVSSMYQDILIINSSRKYITYINNNTRFYYNNNKNITCVIHSIEYIGFLPRNPKINLWVTYENDTQSNLVTTKYDFERLWSISM